MLATRVIIPLVAFLLAVGIAVAAALLPFIPSWSNFQVITAILGIAGGVATGVWLVRGIWLHTLGRLQMGFRIVLSLAAGFLMAAMVCVAGMLCLFLLSGGLFSPQYHHEVQFPEYNTTIYVYDNSFLDPVVLFRYRRGWLPFTHEIGSFGGPVPEDVEIVQDGEWAVHDMFRLHLPTGEVQRWNER